MHRIFNIMAIVYTFFVTQFIMCYVISPVLSSSDMCKHPIPIKNPYYGKPIEQLVSKSNHKVYATFSPEVDYTLKDTHSKYLLVKCGNCKDCRRSRQMAISQRAEMESLNCYTFFLTLTYDNEHLPIYKVNDEIIIPYASRDYVRLMFKRIRKNHSFYRPFRFLAVSERGASTSRPHHHALIWVPKYDSDNEFTPFQIESDLFELFKYEWRVNLSADTFHPEYEPLFKYIKKYKFGRLHYNYDLHYVQPRIDDVTESVSFYVTKYVTKSNKYERELFKHLKFEVFKDDAIEFSRVWRLVRSGFTASRAFGLQSDKPSQPSPAVLEHLQICLDSSTEGIPIYFSPYSFSASGLCPYYCNNPVILSPERLREYHKYLHEHGYMLYTDDATRRPSQDTINPNNDINEDMLYDDTLNRIDYDDISIEELYAD